MGFLKISYLVIALLVLAAKTMATNSEGISLNEAVLLGNISMVKRLIAEGSDVNDATWIYEKTSPLMEAAEKGDKEICKILIAAGADVNQQNLYRQTALYAAVDANRSQDIIEMLIEAGADVNVRNVNVESPLMRAVYRQNTKICKLLISKGADVNYKDEYGDTALVTAIRYGNNLDILKMLIEAGADVNYQNSHGDTPLFLAVDRCSNARRVVVTKEIIQALIEAGADINVEKPITKDHHHDEGGTAFMKAMFWCTENLEIFEPFISAGIDLNHQWTNGMTALRLAMFRNDDLGSYSEMIKFLVDAGADVNAWPKGFSGGAYPPGWTPLMYMARKRDEEMCKFLISRGAKVGEGSGLVIATQRRLWRHSVMRLLQEEEEKIDKFLATLNEEGNNKDY